MKDAKPSDMVNDINDTDVESKEGGFKISKEEYKILRKANEAQWPGFTWGKFNPKGFSKDFNSQEGIERITKRIGSVI